MGNCLCSARREVQLDMDLGAIKLKFELQNYHHPQILPNIHFFRFLHLLQQTHETNIKGGTKDNQNYW